MKGAEARLARLALIVAPMLAVATVAPPAVRTATPGPTAPTAAWGHVGHALLTGAAVDATPEPIAAFYRRHRSFLQDHSIDPDVWRATQDGVRPEDLCVPDMERPALEGDETPRHYIDADLVEPYPFGGIPRDFAEYSARAGEELASWGTAPWAIAAYTDLLSEAMREGDVHAVLCRSAALAHYIGDLSQPLHTTANYDGQLSGLEGIHYRFESAMVEAFEPALEADLSPDVGAVRVIEDPLEGVFEILLSSHPGVYDLLHADLLAQRAAPLAPDGAVTDNEAYLEAMWQRSGALARERLRAAAASVASYWVTAWERAGRPVLPSD